MIKIEFDHRLEEHRRARRLYYARQSVFSRIDKLVAILAVAYGLFALVAVGLVWWVPIPFVAAPLIWFNVLTIEPWVVRYVFRRSTQFHQHTTLTFDEDHIHYQTASIDSRVSWNLYRGVIEDDELFVLLYKAPRSFAIIPKRAFASEAERAAFRTLAQHKILRRAA